MELYLSSAGDGSVALHDAEGCWRAGTSKGEFGGSWHVLVRGDSKTEFIVADGRDHAAGVACRRALDRPGLVDSLGPGSRPVDPAAVAVRRDDRGQYVFTARADVTARDGAGADVILCRKGERFAEVSQDRAGRTYACLVGPRGASPAVDVRPCDSIEAAVGLAVRHSVCPARALPAPAPVPERPPRRAPAAPDQPSRAHAR